MGKVAMLIKVFPADMKHYEAIKENISKNYPVGRIDEEPVAFGFKCLKVVFVLDDKEGGSELEEKLKQIEGVSEVQVEDVGLIS